jgi:hypothetical protein
MSSLNISKAKGDESSHSPKDIMMETAEAPAQPGRVARSNTRASLAQQKPQGK